MKETEWAAGVGKPVQMSERTAVLLTGPQPRGVPGLLSCLARASASGEQGIPHLLGELIYDLVCKPLRQARWGLGLLPCPFPAHSFFAPPV